MSPIRHRIATAIAGVGQPVLVKYREQSATIVVSIQPDFSHEKDISGGHGFGNATRYQLYHAWGANSELLREQAEIVHKNRRFVVERVDDYYYQNMPVYRKARLLLVEQ